MLRTVLKLRQERPLGIMTVVLAELRCAVSTLSLVVRGQVHMPRDMVGREIGFADGTRSKIYRETAMGSVAASPQVMLAVRFRLRLIGSSSLWHAIFRFESVLNTLLFAAQPGFHTKLWLTDRSSDFYRGIYEWQDTESASAYAEVLHVVLFPWVQTGSFAYRIIDGARRSDFLGGRLVPDPVCHPEDMWWLPTGPVLSTEGPDGV